MSTDPRAALALARLLDVIVKLDADQLGDLVSMAEEMTAHLAAPEGEAGEAPELVPEAAPPPLPAVDPAEESRLVLRAQARLEAQRVGLGLTRDGERRARHHTRGGAPQVAREAIRTAIKAKGTH